MVVTGFTGDRGFINESVVRGGVTLRDNAPINEELEVGGNTIGGNLDCSNNSPDPTDDGDPNTVGGAKLGECAGL